MLKKAIKHSDLKVIQTNANYPLLLLSDNFCFQIDELVRDVLELCDGRSLNRIINSLKVRYSKQEVIEAVSELAQTGIVTCGRLKTIWLKLKDSILSIIKLLRNLPERILRLCVMNHGDEILREAAAKNPQKILVYSFDSDTREILPPLKLLKDFFDEAHIEVLACVRSHPENRGAPRLRRSHPSNQGSPNVNIEVVSDYGKVSIRKLLNPRVSQANISDFFKTFKIISSLRREKFDLVVGVYGFRKTPFWGWLFGLLCGGRARIAYYFKYSFMRRILLPYLLLRVRYFRIDCLSALHRRTFPYYSRLFFYPAPNGRRKAKGERRKEGKNLLLPTSDLRLPTSSSGGEVGAERILAVIQGGIGDALISIPALRALRSARPYAYIACLVPTHSYELMIECPYIDKVMVKEDKRGLSSIPFFQKVSLAKKVREHNFDTAIIFRDWEPMIENEIPYLAGIENRIGPGCITPQKAWKYTRSISSDSIHQIEKDMALVPACRVHDADRQDFFPTHAETELELWIPSADRDYVNDFLQKSGVSENDRLVGINPGASVDIKRWQASNFAEVISILAKKHKLKIVITGGRDDVRLAYDIAKETDANPIISAGNLTLLQTAALIERCRLFISNDSGPMHIAIAVKTPTVAIFGPTDPNRWGPLDRTQNIVVKAERECELKEPCMQSNVYGYCPRGNPICINSITPAAVIAAAEKLLNRSDA